MMKVRKDIKLFLCKETVGGRNILVIFSVVKKYYQDLFRMKMANIKPKMLLNHRL